MFRGAAHVFAIAFSLILAACLFPSYAVAADAGKMIEQMEASWPDWLPKLDKCPADLMPQHQTSIDYSIERCSNALNQCISRCRDRDASECYSAALVLQKVKSGPVSEALFSRACALGFISGCTNRAASLDSASVNECSIRTYNLACDRNDPWACTMIAFHLIRGIGVDKDYARARKALSQSCRLGEDDEACRYAKALLKEIGD